MYAIEFNGPPGSGKDTLARMVAERVEQLGCNIAVKEDSLSLPLRKIAYAMTGWTGMLDGENYARFKTTMFDQFNFKDGRQLMIDVSESFLKPMYGIEVMANMLIVRNFQFDGLLLIRDSGFQIEVDPIISYTGTDNFLVVQVKRAGHDFTNDSREWVTHKKLYDVNNDGTLDDLRVEADRIVGRLLNNLHWKL